MHVAERTLLFLCTGNYYRSRFAELYFRHLADRHQLDWQVDSRGLRLHAENVGPLSQYARAECERIGIPLQAPLRFPIALVADDLRQARLIIAMKETEHRVLVRSQFPEWEDRIEYWEVHDLDAAPSEEAFRELRRRIEALIDRLRSNGG